MRLNLGSGPRAVPGWVNIDRSPNIWLERMPLAKVALRKAGLINDAHMTTWDREIRRHDIRSLPYEDHSIEAIYSSHTLEHLYLDDARQALTEWHRVLRPAGVLRLALPDAEAMARTLIEALDKGDELAAERWNESLLAHPERPATGIGRLRAYAGGHIHRWQPTASMTGRMLHQAGFSNITRCDFQKGSLPGLVAVETRPHSFFLEANA